MGADVSAAWLGVFLVSTLSFVPAMMAPTEKARDVAGRLARLSLPVSVAFALWTTLSALSLAPPPGGVVMYAAYPLLVAPALLAAWGIGLASRWAVAYWLGWSAPPFTAVLMAAGSVAFVLAVR